MYPQISRLICLACLVIGFGGIPSIAQEAKNIPIYLDEPEPEPTARVVKRQPLKETYEDKTPRIDREVVKLSDDRILNDGKFIEYYRNGKKYCEGTYKMGVFEGDWQYWFPNGQLCKRVSFKNGKVDGQWEEFDKEGKRTSQKGYRDGKRHGKWIAYHEGGKTPKSEINFDAGVPVGERFTYFENGQKRQAVSFKDGKMDGLMVEWDKTGKKRAEATFKDGVLAGKIKRFDE